MPTRAKFTCHTATPPESGSGATQYQFYPVTDDGIPENQRFHKYTPAGSLQLSVDNPAVSFEPGKSYYIDITEAD